MVSCKEDDKIQSWRDVDGFTLHSTSACLVQRNIGDTKQRMVNLQLDLELLKFYDNLLLPALEGQVS